MRAEEARSELEFKRLTKMPVVGKRAPFRENGLLEHEQSQTFEPLLVVFRIHAAATRGCAGLTSRAGARQGRRGRPPSRAHASDSPSRARSARGKRNSSGLSDPHLRHLLAQHTLDPLRRAAWCCSATLDSKTAGHSHPQAPRIEVVPRFTSRNDLPSNWRLDAASPIHPSGQTGAAPPRRCSKRLEMGARNAPHSASATK